jgi:predicted metal-dependent hydrolase
MNVLTLERIAEIAADRSHRTGTVPPGEPDLRLPFVPEEFTPLYYTRIYAKLSVEQRIRYNQLAAMRVNEYIMMLERDIVDPVLKSLRSHGAVRAGPALRRALDGMLAEEERHYQAFVELNRRCEPRLYGASDWCFMRLRPYERTALRAVHMTARWLPFALWIIIAMEEFSIGLAAAIARDREGGPLGPLDAHFAAIHREHAKDEARHIHIDVHLIRNCLASLPGPWRAVNARLFMTFMRDMTAPKANGTGTRVVRRLVAERPELAPLEVDMIAQMVALRHDETFQRSLFGRQLTPFAFALYDEEPAFERLGDVLKSYERPRRSD